nr:hypothetical protein CFP56_70317 [Quercus suber]
MSFKDKLVGEISGAYTQSFNFGDFMEDDAKSDEEVEVLWQGVAAVMFSKEFKQLIRAGHLDCVPLGHGFFLAQLSLKEDFEKVLKKGPWFISEHFISLRPWEPNFKPETANVTSVAIEYYHAEAHHHIGSSIF